MEVISSRIINKNDDVFRHLLLHNLPCGDGPYVKAKHAQLVEKDPEGAIVWFWKAINGGDRVDSALKDMVVVMQQLDRAEEAIEAIKSFRCLCSKHAQTSLDNLLIDLYKGNLGWAYMLKSNFMAAEVVYKKAQMIDPDANKACNLGLCLIKQARYREAQLVLQDIIDGRVHRAKDPKANIRARELLTELEAWRQTPSGSLENHSGLNLDDDLVNDLERLMNLWAPNKSKRLPVFEEIEKYRDQLAC